MRLHQLDAVAFGPFADTVSVDFDALSEAGLFLLTGATGAGKTSILDAVCFALYGEVPGDRQGAKRLRSDQADAGVAAEVRLELSVAGRRLRIVRSPAWHRPKRRGSGTTQVPASVHLSERVDGAWVPLSSRLDETGLQVTELLGMNATQFCQVVMLPQGRFQSFLRARSDERHRLLQRLFRTARFEEVERWLAERRRTLRRESGRHSDVVAGLVNRISEAADETLPAEWDVHDLVGPASSSEVTDWAARLRDQARRAATTAAARAERAAEAEVARAEALAAATRLAEHRSAHAEAAAEHARLTAAADERADRIRRIERARRAATVRPLHVLAGDQERAADAARLRAHELARAAHELLAPKPPSEPDLGETARASAEAAAAARSMLPREQALGDVRAELARNRDALASSTEERDEVAARLATFPEELARLRDDLAAANRAADRLDAATTSATALRRRAQAATRAAALRRDLVEARDGLRAAVDEAQHRKEIWLQLHEQRIQGMAAELAGGLAVGHDCPVCGSADHPHPATARQGAPDAAAEKAARAAADDGEVARQAHDGRVRDLVGQIAALTETADGDADELVAGADEADAEVEQATTSAREVPRLSDELCAAESLHERLVERRDALALEIATSESALTARSGEADTIQRELDDLLAGSTCTTLESLVRHHEQVADTCERAARSGQEATTARARLEELTRRASDAARAAGFDDLPAALGAVLEERELQRLEADVRDHDAALVRADSRLADPDLLAAASSPAPDVPRRRADLDASRAELASAREEAAVCTRRATRLDGLVQGLGSAVSDWGPVRRDLTLVTDLAALADGSSPDNRLRMRLSGYVLAARLSQVVAAANERLSRMSDRRYSLEHTGERGVGETRGGLSLLVRDDWSGEARDPATLSGGETFVVSLALALGLADVITHEVGGTDLDTLFVDEGFGSLDADTLDDVMDTLDSLREGGRVVGVVSHVAQMRERIPTQLQVDKQRHGSTVRLRRHG